MGLESVRRSYGVPAYRGAKVAYRGKQGRITSADKSARLRLRMDDGWGSRLVVHPKDEGLIYLEPDQCSNLCAPGSGERCMVTDYGECGS